MYTPEDVKARTPEMYWEQIDFGEPNECWEWLGQTSWDKRYGLYDKIRAHRFMLIAFEGKLPKGICALHNCPNGDNPKCVNPNHLWSGTQEENMKDMSAKDRVRHGEKAPFAKLTEEQVKECYRRMHSGESTRSLAKEYGVGKTIMGMIRLGKKWKRTVLQTVTN